jgi:hypothetical protein
MKKERTAHQWGVDHNSCDEALEWRKSLGAVTQKEAFEVCERGDWLIWQLQRLEKEQLKEILPQLLTATNSIVERSVRNHALNCGIKEVEQWAINWLNGNKSARSARSAWTAARAATWAVAAAHAAADAAGAAAAYAAADATGAVAGAVWAAQSAAVQTARAEDTVDTIEEASSEELKLQALDIKKEIPEWVWEV